MKILKCLIRKSKYFKSIPSKINSFYLPEAKERLEFYFYLDKAWFVEYNKRGRWKYETVLNDHFINWQNPSQEEIIMFELQTGIKYLDYWLGLREE